MMMVSAIEYDANRELCDRGPRFDATTIIDQHCRQPPTDDASTESVTITTNAADDDADAVNIDAKLAKRALKLELGQEGVEKGSLDNEDDEKVTPPELLSPVSNSSEFVLRYIV